METFEIWYKHFYYIIYIYVFGNTYIVEWNIFKTEKIIVLHLFQPGAEDRDK